MAAIVIGPVTIPYYAIAIGLLSGLLAIWTVKMQVQAVDRNESRRKREQQ